jgi:uncharacterized membrane protein YfcA
MGNDPMGNELRVQWKIFLALAAFIALYAAIYWFVSYEDAGTTLLALASGLALLFGGYLLVQDRKAGPATTSSEPVGHYLPESSLWPLGIGVGVFLAFNGLILGLPWTVPGVVLVATSVGGFVRQSRHRA